MRFPMGKATNSSGFMDLAHIAGLGFGSVIGISVSISRRHQALIGRLISEARRVKIDTCQARAKKDRVQEGGAPLWPLSPNAVGKRQI